MFRNLNEMFNSTNTGKKNPVVFKREKERGRAEKLSFLQALSPDVIPFQSIADYSADEKNAVVLKTS